MSAVLFDLDGTLVDTAPDLTFSLNELRRRRGLPPVAEEAARAQASHGSQGLIRLGFGVSEEDADFPGLRAEFLDIYTACMTERSGLFPEMAELLDALEGRGIAWGVVTNKPRRLTEPLLGHLGLMARAGSVVSGDTCAHAKPHPQPVLHACAEMDLAPQGCLYVGDAERDVAAARAAGMPTLVAMWGYLGANDRPETWGAAGFIASPAGLLDWLDRAA